MTTVSIKPEERVLATRTVGREFVEELKALLQGTKDRRIDIDFTNVQVMTLTFTQELVRFLDSLEADQWSVTGINEETKPEYEYAWERWRAVPR